MLLNSKEKVASIVLIQIALIVTSFLILVYIESEWLILGNAIDNSGLNRFLAVNVMLEIHSINIDHFGDNSKPSIEELRENIFLLKNGGANNGETIKPIPDELLPYWNTLHADYENFENGVSSHNFSDDDFSEHNYVLSSEYASILKSSDKLTSAYSSFLEKKDLLLIQLQLILLFVNSIAHVFLILVIFRILNKESEEKIKLEKFATIGQLGASIAHDLRNPLTVIKGSFDIFKLKKDPPLNEKEEKLFEKISTSIDQIEYRTKDILDFTKYSELHLEETGLLKIITNSLDEVNVPDGIKIKIPINDAKIKVDKVKFQSVISNLIKNSIDAIEGNGNISIELKDEDRNVLLSVTDSGSGIHSKQMNDVFEPLYTTKTMGTGLGLSSCKKIIEQHGGNISVSINPTKFLIKLPKK